MKAAPSLKFLNYVIIVTAVAVQYEKQLTATITNDNVQKRIQVRERRDCTYRLWSVQCPLYKSGMSALHKL